MKGMALLLLLLIFALELVLVLAVVVVGRWRRWGTRLLLLANPIPIGFVEVVVVLFVAVNILGGAV